MRHLMEEGALRVLWEALDARRPDLLASITMRGLIGLSKSEREAVCEELVRDFMTLGRMPDDEPNVRGRLAERLIDLIRSLDSETPSGSDAL